MAISIPTICTVLGVIASVAGIYTDMRITTAAQGERLEAIGRELVHDREQQREFRGEVREFQTDMRADMRRMFDKLDGKADRAK